MKVNFLLLSVCFASFVSRISPLLPDAANSRKVSSESISYICFAPSGIDVGILDLVGSNWSCRPFRYLRSTHRSSFLLICLILLTGDIKLNPGPGPRHPCGSYAIALFGPTNVVSTVRLATSGITHVLT